MKISLDLTLLLNLVAIIVNIFIAIYNIGKNRIIYEVEEVGISKDDSNSMLELNKKLSSGKYTILNTQQDMGNTRMYKYVLGRIKNKGIRGKK